MVKMNNNAEGLSIKEVKMSGSVENSAQPAAQHATFDDLRLDWSSR